MNIIVLCFTMAVLIFGPITGKALKNQLVVSKIRKKRSPDLTSFGANEIGQFNGLYDGKPNGNTKDDIVSNVNEPHFLRRPIAWTLRNEDYPNFYQAYPGRSFISPANYISKRDTEHAIESQQYAANNISNMQIPRAQPYTILNPLIKDQISNIQPSNLLTQFVNGGEVQNENFDRVGSNTLYCSQGDLGREVATKNNIKVHCVKAGREEVICTHGDFTYRISLPEQFMNQDTVESLVSSIYNNIELGRHNSFGIPMAGGFMQGQQVPGSFHELPLAIAKQPPVYLKAPPMVNNNPYNYHIIGNMTPQLANFAGSQQEPKNQVIRLSIPIESQSGLINSSGIHGSEGRGNDPIHSQQSMSVLQPKYQMNNLVGQPPSQNFIGVSNGQALPMNMSNYNSKNQAPSNPQSNGLGYSNGQSNQGGNGGFVNGLVQRQDNVPPVAISIVPNVNGNLDQSNLAYNSKWYAKRSEGDRVNLVQALPGQSPQGQPFQLYLSKRDIGDMDYFQKARRGYNEWCIKMKKPTTQRASINEGRSGACCISGMTPRSNVRPTCPLSVTHIVIPERTGLPNEKEPCDQRTDSLSHTESSSLAAGTIFVN